MSDTAAINDAELATRLRDPAVGFGLQHEPGALQHLPKTAQIPLTSGLLPAASFTNDSEIR